MDSRRPAVICVAFVFACGAMWCSINKASANEPHFAAGDPTSFQKPSSFRPIAFLRTLFRLHSQDPAIKTPLTRAEKMQIAAEKKFEKRENKLAKQIAKGLKKRRQAESRGPIRIEGAAYIEDYECKEAEPGSWHGASYAGNRELVIQFASKYVNGDDALTNRGRLWQKVADQLGLPAGSPMKLQVKAYDNDNGYRYVSFSPLREPPTAKPNE